MLSLKEIDAGPGAVVAHPSGVLSISQKVVPLNLTIDTFGHREPSGADRFEITAVGAGQPGNELALDPKPVKEFFAPAQFFERSDAQKLSSKSFEKYDAGVRISGSEALASDHYRMRDVEYELSYVDSQRNLKRWHLPISPFAVAFNSWSTRGAIAQSPLSHAVNAKSALAPPPVTVAEERFAVVHESDLTLASAAGGGVPGDAGGEGSIAATEAEAFELMRNLVGADPALAGALQVVPEFELDL